jgi:hypothetical protein
MKTKAPISYKPSMGQDRLKVIVFKKLHYKSLNSFMDQAVNEKLNRELAVSSNPEMTRLIAKLTEVIYEHKNWKSLKPTKEIVKKIHAAAEPIESGKVKGIRWKGSVKKTFSHTNS